MKLAHINLDKPIELNIAVSEWIIESPGLFLEYSRELYRQTLGEDGRFVLSKENEIVSLSKEMILITNLLDINLNDKKIINKLYLDLKSMAYDENNYVSTQEIISAIQKYYLNLDYSSEYDLICDENIDVINLFKMMNIKLDYDEDLFTSLNQYIVNVSLLTGTKVIAFINLRSYLDDNQIVQLSKTAEYNHIYLLLIENIQRNSLEGSFRCIIDSDGCEIY